MEFAIGSNPQSPSTTDLPTVFFGNTVGSVTRPLEARYLTMVVTKNPAAAALQFTVEISEELTTWQSGPDNLTILEESPTQLKVRANTTVPTHPRRAMRLKVTGP
ncbi:MAG: hypothetical protein B9S38_17245 [Verrucomicrobiia bacterium Tous-C4TDCM]|nr:MAG: hypothetical protein B9S38_17245 [Verrucomicrobiae bacterium Tous-C4TDCM]